MADKPVALVTGSSSGIGAAVARRLGAAGWRVMVNSSHSVRQGKELADALPEAAYHQANIAVEAQAQDLVSATVSRFGQLDLLVNNAGTTKVIPHHDLEGATPQVWREVFDVNVIGTWQVTVAAVPHLRATGNGAIVNISSVSGSRPAGSSLPYAVSKAAVNHMTRLLAASIGPEIRVNAVAPGLIDTPWTTDFIEPRANVTAGAPLRRIGRPEDVAEAVYAMAVGPYTTGEVLLVDGGVHLR
ncbi:SDR family NAD(P)-dependent oxidoreductase [Catellatospora tritici]|uniref:SDR family NAD(P)-dependent oxidoreductase n=1 Tax=Catellatospora tritici TaxID=2851566 RepID=UPI001C2D753B|nr:SDR family oxidoreductase [Catellatospora tritici]MBV1855595.1 SDR family oxidoreductase [Catellatospora tritici]